MIDGKIYAVTAPNGYRHGCLTREQAIAHAAHLRDMMRRSGWAGKVRVIYRDGSEVAEGAD